MFKGAFAPVLIATAIVRLAIAAVAPLFPDETYFWDWSRRLASGYFDHPPLVAWMIRAGTALFGDTALGVRFVPVVAGVVGTVFIAAAARRLSGDRAALVVAVVFAVMPLSAAGLVLAMPDAGLFASVAAVLYCVVRMLDQPAGSRASLAWWCLMGVAQGLAFWAKYTAVLVPAGLAIALLSRVDWRPRLREAGPYVAIVVASLVFLPVLVWNARHDWASFEFQLRHGLTNGGGSILQRESELVGGQLALASPILFVMMCLAIAHAIASRLRPHVASLFSLVAFFAFAFFVYSATKRRPEANWPAVAYVPAVLVLAAHTRSLHTQHTGSRRWDRWLTAGIAVAGAITLVMYVNIFVPILPVPARRDPAARASGWNDLAREVQAVPSSRFIAGNRYQEASELAFQLPGHPQTLSLNIDSRPNQYDLWPSFADRAARGDTLIFVADDRGDGVDPVVSALTPHFADVGHGRPVSLARRGDVVKFLRIWTLIGWRGTWPTPPLRSRP